ncbi:MULTISPECIES: hypothetical protein [Paraburkholderia]|uniref:hypothetical protein n=1 Tax=Paraburkholderia TaxID=1822464 RepID=UPI00071F4097|nr:MULTISPECIES: hypothetical protein [Paraburkholderia]ALP64775.1 hypothetical protein AN416_19215 [Paraburkholderia caribensis]AUT54076.1 hypothetical protein C2L66_19335 [Paraburkholderia caribensis]MDR6386482.1 hypothetical protein [Paraburkholderia caribensis]
MFRTVICAASLVALTAFISEAAHAGQPSVAGALSANGAAGANGANSATAATAAADKVYPPLPTLAMLPPTTDDDEPLAPKPAAKKRKVRAAVDVRPAAPAARLVVSDASRTYLRSVDRQLDLALGK